MLPGRLEEENFLAAIRKWREMWNGLLRDHLQSMRLIAGNGIRIQHYPAGTVVSAEPDPGRAASAVVPEDDGAGPFAVEVYNADEEAKIPDWRIRLCNSESRSGIAGLVTIGSFRKEIEDREWVAQEGVVYLDITYDPETEEYSIIFDLEVQLPETEDARRYILRIAEITQDAETKIFTAHPVRDPGDIEVTGRWVK